MRNSKWTHIPSQIEHGGTEFDAGWHECYGTKVLALYTAIENALIDMSNKRRQGLIASDLKNALKECDK